jgi:hypothetical protein
MDHHVRSAAVVAAAVLAAAVLPTLVAQSRLRSRRSLAVQIQSQAIQLRRLS